MKMPGAATTFLYAAVVITLLELAVMAPAHAQLRPLDPTDFRALNGERLRVYAGGAVFFSQHASLVGARGRLVELGDVHVSWRSGRIIVEVSGTVQRFFREDTLVSEPAEGVIVPQEGTRRDAGDYRIQTILRLSGDAAQTTTILRFGTRLPTTDNRVGLERDQTDFFASLGAAHALGPLYLALEAGLGIYGTRLSNYEQSDVMIYAAAIEYRGRILSPFLSVVGQDDMHLRAVRGNEDLGEVRAGVRLGRERWLRATFVRGFHDSSPHHGLLIGAGASFGGQR